MIKFLIFDWGNTLMRDFPQYDGPMVEWPEVQIIPGVVDVLEKLYTGYTLCVATNAGVSDTWLMKKALNRVGLDEYFSYYFSSKDLGYQKPDIRFFSEIILKTGFAPSETVMIGNDYSKDIVGAKRSGLSTIFFNEEKINGCYSLADDIAESFYDIPDILKKINAI